MALNCVYKIKTPSGKLEVSELYEELKEYYKDNFNAQEDVDKKLTDDNIEYLSEVKYHYVYDKEFIDWFGFNWREDTLYDNELQLLNGQMEPKLFTLERNGNIHKYFQNTLGQKKYIDSHKFTGLDMNVALELKDQLIWFMVNSDIDLENPKKAIENFDDILIELYKTLHAEVGKGNGNQESIDNGFIVLEKYKEDFKALVLDELKSVSSSYQKVELNEDEALDVENEEPENVGSVVRKSAILQNSKDNANGNTKLFIKYSVPKIKQDGTYKLGTFFPIPQFESFESSWNVLERALSDRPVLYDNMGEFQDRYKDIEERILKYSDLKKGFRILANEFKNLPIGKKRQFDVSFTKSQQLYLTNTVSKNKKSVDIKTMYNNSSDPDKIMFNEWGEFLRDSDYVKNGTVDMTKLLDGLEKYILNLDKITVKNYEKIRTDLAKIGMNINLAVFQHIAKNEETSTNDILINFVANINKYVNGKKVITEVGNFKNPYLTESKSFSDVAMKQSLVNGVVGENTTLGPKGKYWNFALTTYMNQVITAIKNGDSSYLEQLDKSPYANNSVLKQILRDNPNDISLLTFLQAKEIGNKGVDTSNLNYYDNLLLSINRTLGSLAVDNTSITNLLANADKSTTFLIKGLPFQRPDLSDEYKDIFIGYIQDELDQYHSEVKEDAYYKPSMFLFPSLLEDKNFLNNNGTMPKNITDSVRRYLTRENGIIENKITEIRETLKNDIGTKTLGTLISKDIIKQESDIDVLLDTYAVNALISNVEFSKVFTGYPGFYKSDIDFFKRVAATQVDGLSLSLSKGDNTHRNIAVIEKVEIKPHGNIRTEAKIDELLAAKDLNEDEVKFMNQVDLIFESEQALNKPTTRKQIASSLLDYTNVNIADAQAWITLDHAKFLLEHLNEWSDAHEAAFIKVEKGQILTSSELKLFNLQPFKGVQFQLKDGKPYYLKYSQAVLIPSMIIGTQYETMLEMMDAGDIQELITQDGVKVGVETPVKIHDEKGNIVRNNIKPSGTINVYWGQAESEISTKILSNLAPRRFTWEGREYGSVEHAYQSNKSGTFDKATYDKYVEIDGYGRKIRGKGTVAEMKAADSLGLMKNLVVESFRQNPNSEATNKLKQYKNFTHNTNELIDQAFLEGLKLAQKALINQLKPISLENRYWKLQQVLSSKQINEGTLASQIQKNIFANIITMMTPENQDKAVYNGKTGREIVDDTIRIFGELLDEGYASVLGRLEIKDLTELFKPGTSFNKAVLNDILIQELKDKNEADSLIEALERDVDYNKLPSLIKKIEEVFSSYMKKRLIDVHINQASLIQVSNFGSHRLTNEEKSGIFLLTDSDKLTAPKLIKDAEGNVKLQKGQIFIPSWIIAEHIPNYAELSKEELLEMIPKEMLEVIGYRIPNQGMSSNDALEVVGILPPEAGDSVVVYTGLTTKTGSDFDIDKMYMILPNVHPLYRNGEFKTFVMSSKGKKKLQNQLLRNYLDILTSPATFMDLTTSIDKASKVIKDLVTEANKDGENLYARENLFNPITQLKIRDGLLKGKLGIGSIANHIVNHVLTQLTNIELYGNNLNHVYDKEGKNKVIDILSGFLNAFVDIANDPYILDGNFTPFTTSTTAYMLRTGYPIDFVVALMSNKAIRKAYDKSLINNSMMMESDFEDNSDASIVKAANKIVNSGKLVTYKKQIESGQMNDDLVFEIFKVLKTQASDLTDIVQSLTFDVYGAGNSVAKHISTIIKTYNALEHVGYKNMYKNTIQGKRFKNGVLDLIEGEKNAFVEANFIDELEKASQILFGKSFTDLNHEENVLDSLANMVRTQQLKSQLYVEDVYSLFTERSLTKLNEMKSKYPDNELLKVLQTTTIGKKVFYNINSLRNKSPFEKNQLYYGWKELLSTEPKFAEDLVKKSFYQSTFTQGIGTFYEFIPPEFYDRFDRTFEVLFKNSLNLMSELNLVTEEFARNNTKLLKHINTKASTELKQAYAKDINSKIYGQIEIQQSHSFYFRKNEVDLAGNRSTLVLKKIGEIRTMSPTPTNVYMYIPTMGYTNKEHSIFEPLRTTTEVEQFDRIEAIKKEFKGILQPPNYSTDTNILEKIYDDLYSDESQEGDIVLEDPQAFLEWYENELENNPNLTMEEAVEYYKKCH